VENLLTYRDKPPPKLELLAKMIGLPSARLRHFLGELERSGRVVRLADGVYVTNEDLAAWREKLQAYLHTHQHIKVTQFRDQAGINRNFAVLVLERFDQEGVTNRVGDSRVAGPRATENFTTV
jgi:selenocysteine-specific elongation factor